MKKFTDASEIITTEMEKSDLEDAIRYTTISLPWTFDRMQYGFKSQRSVNDRIMNILKGVLNQSILKRALEERGYECGTDWSNYRESDIFDFEINDRLYDVKTTHVYSEYGESDDSQYGGSREPISPELIEKYRDNEGPEWKTFLPMIVPFTQLRGSRKKDEFIFGIAETQRDIRRTDPEEGDDGFWVAAPYNEGKDRGTHFFHTENAIRAREEKGQGFNISFQWGSEQTTLADNDRQVEITIFGEWDGDRKEETFTLSKGDTYTSNTEFSSFSMARVKNAGILSEHDEIVVTPNSNYDGKIPKPTNPNIDLDNDDLEWVLKHDSFVDLSVPSDYSVMWIGHIPQNEFFEDFQQYPAWFNPKEDHSKNEPVRATESLKDEFKKLDKERQQSVEDGEEVSRPELMSFVTEDEEVNAGILHAAYRPGGPLGAASYYYPPYTFREKALYVLPSDLYTMDTLPKDNN